MMTTVPATVASWSMDGMSFAIKDPKEFAATILPKYFKHNNFNSFVRQLSLYGFQKSKTDATPWHFHHRCFQRHNPDLMVHIKRKTSQQASQNHTRAIQDLRSDLSVVKSSLGTLRDQTERLVKIMQGMLVDHDKSLGRQQGESASFTVQASARPQVHPSLAPLTHDDGFLEALGYLTKPEARSDYSFGGDLRR
ncbi:hypothetical protein AC1031_021696 [Aphanomyces cochlioides]|nr:hypothetical protein AC1031_021696 [Aphanomyces cochlioides]